LIRDFQITELITVSRLINDAFKQYAPSTPSKSWQSYLEEITDVPSRLGDSELIVAELQGRIIGSITLYLDSHSVDQKYLKLHRTDQGWPKGWASIRLLAVHPEYRRMGVGRGLLEECVRRCLVRSVSTIGLHTTEIMEVARQIYERRGFVRAPEFDFHPAPNSLVMAYRLDL
jgi:GNAT superfamily N-acetyltransferase